VNAKFETSLLKFSGHNSRLWLVTRRITKELFRSKLKPLRMRTGNCTLIFKAETSEDTERITYHVAPNHFNTPKASKSADSQKLAHSRPLRFMRVRLESA
jgi:hypothetical protein